MVAELQAGDTIYIPRRWWHHVRTTAVSLSVNHWWARGTWATLVKSADLFKRMRGISR
jgi:oxalate decarboxylase/phosphoglucose isomerase-like protein (cupin superfamily)